MAVLFAVAVYDRAVGAYNRPMFVPAVGAALRSFQDECGNPESPLSKHPGDFELVQIGLFDEEKGLLSSVEHKRLALAADMRTS